MKAAILYGGHDFRIEEIESPKINDNQCLIKVATCGVCHSEIHQWLTNDNNLEYPRFIGHEIAGEIVNIGSNIKSFNIGDRVAVWTDGKGYAEEVAVTEESIFKIAPMITYKEALAEPIGCTTNGVLKASIKLNDTVAIVGTGFMGLILLQQIKLMGTKNIIAIDIRDDMLEIAKTLGADYLINPIKDNLKSKIDDLTSNKGVDIAFEVGGNSKTLNTAATITRMEGKLVIFGFHPGERTINDLGYWNWMAFDIINAHFRYLRTILEGTRIGMDLLNESKIDMKPLITNEYPLDKIENAFQAANDKNKGFIKAVIAF